MKTHKLPGKEKVPGIAFSKEGRVDTLPEPKGPIAWIDARIRVIIIWRLHVQSWQKSSNNTGILSTCTRLYLTESEQAGIK